MKKVRVILPASSRVKVSCAWVAMIRPRAMIAIYISNSATAYTDTVNRDQLSSLGRASIERVTRELRSALPNSIRVQNNCVEFFPVQIGSSYFSLPVDARCVSTAPIFP